MIPLIRFINQLTPADSHLRISSVTSVIKNSHGSPPLHFFRAVAEASLPCNPSILWTHRQWSVCTQRNRMRDGAPSGLDEHHYCADAARRPAAEAGARDAYSLLDVVTQSLERHDSRSDVGGHSAVAQGVGLATHPRKAGSVRV